MGKLGHNGINQYRKVGVNTANKGKLLLMLYEGVIRYCEQAKRMMQKKDYAAKGKYIVDAQAIIHELMHTLDHNVAPELCTNLENLYLFMSDKLTKANIEVNEKDVDTVINLLQNLKNAWSQVIEKKS